MKILQIAPPWINTPPSGYGGTEWVVSNLITGLSNLGHRVTLFATKRSKTKTKLDYVFEKGLLEMKIPWEAALPPMVHYHQAFKQAASYDLVHAHLSSQTDVIVLPFLSDLSRQGVPVLLTVHGHAPFDRFSNMDKYYLDLYGGDIWAVAISQVMLERLPKQLKKAGFLYNSMDTSVMQFSAKGGSYLTWLGKIKPDKGTFEAIQIAKKAGEQLVFAGIVDECDKESVNYFEEKVKPLIDNKQVIYLGPADLKLKNKLLKNAKAFINPLQWEEPFGMVMLESMTCGTPVLAYNRGAVPELVADQETGFVVKDEGAILKAIKKIGEIDRRHCRDYVEAKFSPEAAAKSATGIYAQVIRSTVLKTKEARVPIPTKPAITA